LSERNALGRRVEDLKPLLDQSQSRPHLPLVGRLAGHHVLDAGNVLGRAEDQLQKLERDRADIGQGLLDDRVLEQVAADIDGLIFAGS
jgi:hypothetical protein